MKIVYDGVCDIGLKREINQDSILMLANDEKQQYLFAVADGMGGHSDGEIASSMITDALKQWWNIIQTDEDVLDFRSVLESMQNKLREINNSIYEIYNKNAVCGSTCIALIIYGNQYGIVSVGDSRIYMRRNFTMKSVMTDDVWENQSIVRESMTKGQIKRHKNYGKLINALGTSDDVKLSMKADVLKLNDLFILCSDGLYKYCDEKYLKRISYNLKSKNIKDKIKFLIRKVYKDSASDNISIIMVKCMK